MQKRLTFFESTKLYFGINYSGYSKLAEGAKIDSIGVTENHPASTTLGLNARRPSGAEVILLNEHTGPRAQPRGGPRAQPRGGH